MPWLRRVHSPYRTRAHPVIILSMWVVIEIEVVCEGDAQDRDVLDSFRAFYNGWW